MPGLLARTRLVQQCPGQERDLGRLIARWRYGCLRGGLGRSQWRCRILRGRRRLDYGRSGDCAELRVEGFEHPRGFFATGDAKVQPLFALEEDRIGVVLATVAALAAILLAHRRHHAPPQRPHIGKLHSLGERDPGIVPRRLAVIAVVQRPARRRRASGALQQCRRFSGGERINAAIERQKPGKETVQPGTLLGRKWRRFRNEVWDRRRRGVSHSYPCRSNMALSASTWCRRVNSAKFSWGPARLAR